MRHITYSIPTRNRPENLKSVLLRLLPQLDSSSVVNVIDNASDIFAESIVNDVREHLGSDVVINVFRNEVDLGGSANVLKCFEYCNTQWNYIVGDSKLPTESAVSTVLHDIGTFNDCLFINYYYESEFHSVRDQSEIVYGFDSLLDKMGSFGNMILLGNTVYNNERVKKYLSVGYLNFVFLTIV